MMEKAVAIKAVVLLISDIWRSDTLAVAVRFFTGHRQLTPDGLGEVRDLLGKRVLVLFHVWIPLPKILLSAKKITSHCIHVSRSQ
jgi:hypothetical protein